MNKTISMVVAVMILALGHQGLSAATNLVSNVLVVTNQCKTIVTYTMEKNGTARVNDPTGRLIGTAEEAALRVAAEGQGAIASAAQVAAESARWEWDAFIATNDTHIVYIDAGFEQDLPALATNFCGWVASSFYDRERGEDHYYIWFNRELDYPPSMAARIVSESGTNWLDGAWVDWNVTHEVRGVLCRELVVKRRNDMCVLKTGTTITLGGKDGFNADIHNVNIEVGGTPTATTAVSAPFYAVTIDGTNRVVTAFTNGFINVENGFIKEPTVDPSPQPPLPPIEWSGLAFTFEEAGTELKLMKNSSSAQAITLQISTDGGATWSEWAETNGVSSFYPFRSFVSTSAGQKICLRGDNETISTAWNSHYYFSMNGRISASGNIQSIVGFSEDVAPFCYYNLFVDCASLVTAPELPATTLADSCYDGMFSGCSSLVTAPALPATTLAYACYDYMFYGCASLVTAPELPATTLAGYCYAYMFFDCTSLASITMLATNVDAGGCLDRWVEGVAPTGTFTKAEGMTTLPTGRSGIPEGWEVRSFERQ